MIEQENQTATVEAETTTTEEATEEVVSLKKSEYDSLNQTLGSLKRELKDLKKSKTETKETSPQLENVLVEKVENMLFRAEGITHPDDKALARETAKKWGVDVETLLDDEDFKAKLDKQRTQRSNLDATSGIRGDKSGGSAKDTTAYWQAKGHPPTPDEVSDQTTRRKIIRDMMSNSKSKPKFYNG